MLINFLFLLFSNDRYLLQIEEVDVIFLFAGGRGGHLYAIIYTDYNKPHMIKHYQKTFTSRWLYWSCKLI